MESDFIETFLSQLKIYIFIMKMVGNELEFLLILKTIKLLLPIVFMQGMQLF
jgi:hypothetical protein